MPTKKRFSLVLASSPAFEAGFYGITSLYRKNPKALREDLPKIFALVAAKKILLPRHRYLPTTRSAAGHRPVGDGFRGRQDRPHERPIRCVSVRRHWRQHARLISARDLIAFLAFKTRFTSRLEVSGVNQQKSRLPPDQDFPARGKSHPITFWYGSRRN